MKIEPLNKIFNNTQNSYKFYWWLTIIEKVVEKKDLKISFDEIVLGIISKLWFPVNFYKLSFGKLDRCANYIVEIKKQFEIPEDIDEKKLLNFLVRNKDSALLQRISSELTRYVPYRFIRPWYAAETRSLKDSIVNRKILNLQNEDAPYVIDAIKQQIILNEETIYWITSNYKILEAHTCFELLKYLEKNNLNVSNLSRKLVKPQYRNLSGSTKLWSGFIDTYNTQTDVFEKKLLKEISILSIDHFLPWSFIAHDLVWNLHPVEKSINSKKSNFIPSTNYLNTFSTLQYFFSRYLIEKSKKQEIESYCVLFKCSQDDFSKLQKEKFKNLMKNFYKPQIQIAANMGFESKWTLF